eukprot:116583_1
MAEILKGVAATAAGLTLAGGLFFYSNTLRDSDWTTYRSTLNPQYFANRIIWITGASSGIGKALTIYLDSLNVGVKFVLSARRQNLLQDIKCSLQTNGKDIYILPMELNQTDATYHENKYKAILSYFNVSSIDILINNAGFSMRSDYVDMALTDSLEMLQTNLVSPIILTKLVLNDMVKNNKNDKEMFGHIVNVTSVAAKLMVPMRTTYVATKSGLFGFDQSLNNELTNYKNISITDILPGAVATDVDIASKGKHGKPHNRRDIGIQSGMTATRCAELILVAVSNRIFESWPVKPPALNLMYMVHYFPGLYDQILRSKVARFVNYLDRVNQSAGYLPSKL